MFVAHLAAGGRPDEGKMTFHQFRKGALGAVRYVSLEQFAVGHANHSSYHPRAKRKPTRNFNAVSRLETVGDASILSPCSTSTITQRRRCCRKRARRGWKQSRTMWA